MSSAPVATAIRCPRCGYSPLEVRSIGHRRLYRCVACEQEFAELQPGAHLMRQPTGSTQVIAPLWSDGRSICRPLATRSGDDSSVILSRRELGIPPRPDPDATERIAVSDNLASTRTSVISVLKSRYGSQIIDRSSPLTPLPELQAPVLAAQPPPPAKYRLRDDIAIGGVGRITLAEDRDLNRRVAMKSLLPQHAHSPEHISRLLEEAQTVGQLEHPNIVPVYDVGMHETGDVFFTMKFVRGETLETIIRRLRDGDPQAHALYPWSRRVQIISQVCDALAYAHGRGVIHRDLKPANVMIGEYGEVQVMDWGTAKAIGAHTPTPPDTPLPELATEVTLTAITPHETSPGNVVGTAFYMSPEQAHADQHLSPASDIYSLGSMMYEFFSLHRAHSGNTVFDVLRDVIENTPNPIADHRHPAQARVPIELAYIVADAMQKDPERRYPSVACLQQDLQRYLAGTFPVRCRATAAKRALHIIGGLVDNHARCLFIAFSLAAATATGALLALALSGG